MSDSEKRSTKQVAIIKAKNKVSHALMEAVPLLFDDHEAEQICSMVAWREQILYRLLDAARHQRGQKK